MEADFQDFLANLPNFSKSLRKIQTQNYTIASEGSRSLAQPELGKLYDICLFSISA